MYKRQKGTCMKTVLIATNNAHKAEEIASALAFEDWEFRLSLIHI